MQKVLEPLQSSCEYPGKERTIVGKKYKSNLLISEVPTLCNSRTGPMSAELETMRTSRSPTTVMTANGQVQTREATVDVKELDLFVTVMLLEEFFLSGSSVRIMGFPTTGPAVKNHISPKKGRRIDCNISIYVPFEVLGLSTKSSTTPTPTSSSSSSQDSVFYVKRYTETPVPERSGSASEELWGNLQQKPTETENTKNEGREEVQSDLLHDLPDWLQDFIETLVDESSLTDPLGNPAPKDGDTSSSSHELRSEPRAKVVPSKHNMFTHFPKDPNCDICLRTKVTSASCRRRAQSGTFW